MIILKIICLLSVWFSLGVNIYFLIYNGKLGIYLKNKVYLVQ